MSQLNQLQTDRDPNPRLSSIISKSPDVALKASELPSVCTCVHAHERRASGRRPLRLRMCVWRTAIPLRRPFLIATLAYTHIVTQCGPDIRPAVGSKEN